MVTHYSFQSLKMSGIRKNTKQKEIQKQERKAFKHDLKIGDILYSSWGYDQTNIDFYEVVEVVSDKSVKIREIAYRSVDSNGLHSMAGEKVAIPGQYVGEPMLKRVGGVVGGGCVVGIDKHQHASLWNGKPIYYSWYA